MSRGLRILQSLPFGIAAGSLAAITGRTGLAAGAAVISLAAWLPSRTRTLHTAAQALVAVGCVVLAFVAHSLDPEVTGLGAKPLKPIQTVLGFSALWLAALRAHLTRPEGGLEATLGLGLLVFLASGGTRSGPVYPATLVAFVLAAWLTLRLSDAERMAGPASPDRPVTQGRGWLGAPIRARHTLAALALAGIATGVTGSLAWGIPIASQRVTAWAIRQWEQRMSVSGFHDGAVALGSLRGMLQSDEVVMRIHGPIDDHLRGNVYSEYRSGHWLATGAGSGLREWRASPPTDDPRATRFVFVGGDSDRFFLPLGAHDVRALPARTRVDGFGVLRSSDDEPPRTAEIRQGPADFAVLPPREEDLTIPRGLEADLEGLARTWTAGASGPAQKLAAIEERLERDYLYSLSFERTPRADPIREFLWSDRRGHCEYFAAALTLLARAVSVPARMVTGYRASEVNPFGGYTIVRERHAHAWVEAWLPERGWITLDPSPRPEFEAGFRRESDLLPGLIDGIRVLAGQVGPSALLGLLAIVFVWIQLRRLRGARHRVRPETSSSGPPAPLETLLARLAHLGVARGSSECLGAFARRVSLHAERGDDLDTRATLESALPLLRSWVGVRYGPSVHGPDLDRAVQDWIARTRP